MTTPKGWYPDPLGGQGARYWDGTQWEGAIQPAPPPDVQEFPPEPTPTPEKQRRLMWAGLGAAALVAAGSLAFALTRPAEDSSKAAPTPTLTEQLAAVPGISEEKAAAMVDELQSDLDLMGIFLDACADGTSVRGFGGALVAAAGVETELRARYTAASEIAYKYYCPQAASS